MTDIIITAIIVIILAGAAGYVIKAKKSGSKCVGCPSAKTCGKTCCDCQTKDNTK